MKTKTSRFLSLQLCPQLFDQLYTIHGSICGRALPSVYCLLAGKSDDLYDEMFGILLNHISQRPKSITIDFEKAVENVIKRKLPSTDVRFCFFHFKQSLWRKIQVSIVSFRNHQYDLSLLSGTRSSTSISRRSRGSAMFEESRLSHISSRDIRSERIRTITE